MYGLLCLVSFTQHNVLKDPQCCCMCQRGQYFIPFMANNTAWCGWISSCVSIHQLMDIWVGPIFCYCKQRSSGQVFLCTVLWGPPSLAEQSVLICTATSVHPDFHSGVGLFLGPTLYCTGLITLLGTSTASLLQIHCQSCIVRDVWRAHAQSPLLALSSLS